MQLAFILVALSPRTSQSGPRALFPPLTAFFESPYEKGPNWYGQSVNKDQQSLTYQGGRSQSYLIPSYPNRSSHILIY